MMHGQRNIKKLKSKTTTTILKITGNYSSLNGQNLYTFLLTEEVPDTD